MNPILRLLRYERGLLHHLSMREAKALSSMGRLTHPRVLHHMKRVVLGGIVMLSGVMVAKAEVTSHAVHIALDVIGYSIHGLGLIPIAKHVEPLWEFLVD